MSYACPKCLKSVSLWQELTISGWQSVDEELKPTGEREADWTFVEEGDLFGCGECSWSGSRDQLERLGADGKPLVQPHPDQLSMGDAA